MDVLSGHVQQTRDPVCDLCKLGTQCKVPGYVDQSVADVITIPPPAVTLL